MADSSATLVTTKRKRNAAWKRGEKWSVPLNGLFAVSKPGHDVSDRPQRLVMNMVPSNGFFRTIEGDNSLLPDMARMQNVVLDPETFATWFGSLAVAKRSVR